MVIVLIYDLQVFGRRIFLTVARFTGRGFGEGPAAPATSVRTKNAKSQCV
jgi:hypothetical protein